MATLTVEGPDLVVRLSALEKLGGLHGNVRVPLSQIRSVTVEDKPWGLVRGHRLAGSGVPGVIALGVRRFSGRRDFTVVYGTRPVVRVELGEQCDYSRLLIRVPEPAQAAAMIVPSAGAGMA